MYSKRGIVAVACHYDKCVIYILMHELNRIYYQSHISGIFSGNVIKLLFSLNGKPLYLTFPALEGFLFPVAVSSFDYYSSESIDFLYNCFKFC